MDILRTSDLEIVAELGKTTLQLQDIYYLHVGDVIDLGHSAQEPVRLYVEGQPWFSGKMGLQNNNVAIKVLDTYDNQGRREK